MDSAYSHAVKTLSVADNVLTIALYNGTTVNFKKADLSGVSVGASGGLVFVKDSNGNVVEGTRKDIKTGGNNVLLANFSSDTKKADVYFDLLMDGAVFKRSWVNVDVSDAYNAVTISKLQLESQPSFDQKSISYTMYAQASNGATKTFPTSFSVSSYLPSSITRTSYSTTNKTVTVKASNSADSPTSISETISASEIYDAGVSDTKSKMVLGITPGSNKTLGYGESQTVTAEILYNSTTLKKGSVTISAPAKPTIVLGITPGTKTLGYGEVQTVTATVKENGTEVKRGTATITAPPAPPTVTGVSFGAPSLSGTSDLKFSVSVTYSDGTSISLGEKSINGSASYKAGQDSMGLSISGTTVSVAVSETKSATASVGSSHRIASDGSVSLTPGQTFKGAPGTYYKNPRIVADHWINWT